MKYRRLGNSGLEVSSLSYGASALGGVFSDINESEGIQAVHTALDMGVNYIDVSPAYGNTKAEVVLGKALKERNRAEYHLSTKAGKFCTPGEYGGHLFDYSKSAIRRSVKESMQRLGTDYLDIVYLHDIEYDSLSHVEQALGEGIETLKDLKRAGAIGSYGLSTYPMDLWRTVLESVDLDVVMTHSHYCLSDTQLLSLTDICEARGIGLVNSSPLLMGVLTARGPASWFPITKEEKVVAQRAVAFCKENGTSLEKLSIQFSVANDRIPTTLTSSSSPERIRQSIENALLEPDASMVKEVQSILKPIINRDWNFGETC